MFTKEKNKLKEKTKNKKTKIKTKKSKRIVGFYTDYRLLKFLTD